MDSDLLQRQAMRQEQRPARRSDGTAVDTDLLVVMKDPYIGDIIGIQGIVFRPAVGPSTQEPYTASSESGTRVWAVCLSVFLSVCRGSWGLGCLGSFPAFAVWQLLTFGCCEFGVFVVHCRAASCAAC
jgi:hypothetical protein